jgi:hypothetical protein
MATTEKPLFRNHQEEIDWHLTHRHGGPVQKCGGCGKGTMGYTCWLCEDFYQEASRYGRVPKPDTLCSDCAKPCTSCKLPVCEAHSRKSGECVGCSGPTDAEQQRMNDGPSARELADRSREIL